MAVVKLPVLVVGGGIGGFTAALALHRAGISNRLILQEKSLSSTGRSAVLVGGSAVRILDRLGLGPRFRTYGSPITHAEIKTERQRQLISLDFERIGSEVWVVPRSNLLQFFVEALPPGTVHFGTKLRSLAANSESIEAEVQHDLSNSQPLSGPNYSIATSRISVKLVVGADGLASTVRTFMSRPSIAWPSGTYIWQAVVKNRDHEMYPPHFGSEVWASSKSKLSRASRFGFMRISKDEVLWWALVPGMEEVFLRPFLPKLVSLFQEYPEDVQRLLGSVEKDRDIQRRQLRQVWPSAIPWVDHASARIALVGDAGRTADPSNVHQGCSSAVEDSYMLAHYIAEQGGPESSRLDLGLRAYEQNREFQSAKAKLYSDRFYRLSTSNSPISRYILRKFVLSSLENEISRGIALTLAT